MLYNAFDSIVAPITGAPPAAVAWIRISGADAWEIASRVFRPWSPEPRRVLYGKFESGDDGLAIPFLAEHSYTGEDAVELSMHGSRASVQAAIEACLAAGARLADPGEFTLRAFLNGRIDLSQAEGVRESCEALTDRQLRLGARLREGSLSQEVAAVRKIFTALLAGVEASVDFSEEIGDFDRVAAQQDLDIAARRIDCLLEASTVGRVVREGFRIAIVGPPNAGKSSLLNALLREERSIVTEIAGTTRDYVEEAADFDGIPVVLIDTAGLRESHDQVESIGIQRSRAQASRADAIWYVYDASEGWQDHDEREVGGFDRPVTILANKSDLARGDRGLVVSSVTRDGLPDLIAKVKADAGVDEAQPLINRRHEPILREVREAIDELGYAMESDAPDDLLSVLLHQAISCLGVITGETASTDMIERIFADFCIGK